MAQKEWTKDHTAFSRTQKGSDPGQENAPLSDIVDRGSASAESTTIEFIEKENGNSRTTDPNGHSNTDPWYDRPKVADSAFRAPQRDPAQVTGVGFQGDPQAAPLMKSMQLTPIPARKGQPEPKPAGEPRPQGKPTLLNWVPNKKAPLN